MASPLSSQFLWLAGAILLLSGLSSGSEVHLHVSIVRSKDGSPKAIPVSHMNQACSSGWFLEKLFTTGWNILRVNTYAQCSDLEQAFGAGFVEGALSAKQIWENWQNTLASFDVDAALENYLVQNQAFTEGQAAAQHENEAIATYWWQVRLVLEQLKGLAAGYNWAASEARQLPASAFLLINSNGDLYDLGPAFAPAADARPLSQPKSRDGAGSGRKGGASFLRLPGRRVNDRVGQGGARRLRRGAPWEDHAGRCTGFVKLLADNSDLFIAQAAFSGLEEMHRIYKAYDFAYRQGPGASATPVPGARSVFSSYPAFLYSSDDFMVLSSGLALVETTMGIFNTELYKKFVTPNGSVLGWIRSIVASRLARSSEEWTEILARHNSGSLNNQWLVLDYKRFTPGQAPADGALWVAEQIPGRMARYDGTDRLRSTGYFPSYNQPSDPEIRELTGWSQRAKQWDFFDYNRTPRARIMARDHANVHNLDSFKTFLRYNDFKTDPLGRCNACNPPYNGEFGISSRGDLNPANGTYPFAGIGHRDHANLDGKITSYHLAKRLASLAVSGPTCESPSTRVFEWAKSDWKDLPHQGLPEVYNFPWLEFIWDEPSFRLSYRINSSVCTFFN